MSSAVIPTLETALARSGMAIRGGFVPRAEDAVPDLAPGRPARALLLIGNIGGAMWPAFAAAPHDDDDPMDRWTRRVIDPLAAACGATALYPSDGPPYRPFQLWARRAEGVQPSPLMIFIHPQYGLWHAYRAALLFAEDLALPSMATGARPCDSCAGQPCLHACPVDAFTSAGFDDMRCARHVDGPDGTECRERGCLARRACPVGKEYAYPPAQMAFHMQAFLARRRTSV
ncbi:ferredoxin [Dongia sp.]|uniref:ferredoxin n=1 Tax=Dongia sp. TaxID=1977262 RepID=UPI0035B08FC2